MKKSVTTALALTAILASGVGYAVTGDNPDTPVLDITSSVPAEGAELTGLYQGDEVSFTIAEAAANPQMVAIYEIQQREGEGAWEALKTYAYLSRQEDATYTATVYGNYDMYAGIDYRMKVTAWKDQETENYAKNEVLGVGYVEIKGTLKRYEYSPYTLESISPEGSYEQDVLNTAILLPDDQKDLTVSFSGPVNLGDNKSTGLVLGMGGGLLAFESMNPAGASETVDGKVYAKEWNLVFPGDYLATQNQPVTVTIKATDSEGRVVKGTMGENVGSYTQFFYNVEGMYKEMSYDFGEAPLTAVREIKASYNDMAVNPSYATFTSPTVTLNGEVVATVTDCTPYFAPGVDPDDFDAASIGVTLTLDKILTTPGHYELNMPTGYVNIGQEFMTYYQKGQEVEFTISAGAQADVIPAPGDVTELSTFDIQYEVDGELAINSEAQRPYLFIESEQMPSSKWAAMGVMGNTLSLRLTASINEADTYTLVVPTGYLTVDGQPLPGFTAKYTIKAASSDPTDYPAVFTPAPGKVDALPTVIDIVFPDYAEVGGGSGKAMLTAFGSEIPMPDAEFGMEFNEMLQPLPEDFQDIDIEGEYTVTFPAGYFAMGGNGDPSPEMTITYTIGEGDAPQYNVEFTPAPGKIKALPDRIDFIFLDKEVVDHCKGEAYIQFNNEEPVALPYFWYDDDDAYNEGYQPLGDFAGRTEEGTYTIIFPAEYFQFADFSYLNTSRSEEMIIVYTIGEGASTDAEAVFTPESGSVMRGLPERIEFFFPEYGSINNGEGTATIRFNDEAPVDLPQWWYQPDYELNQGYQELGDFAGATEAGTYTITFPAEYFEMDNQEGTVRSQEMVVVYTVDPNAPSDEPVVVEASAVYTPAPGEVSELPELVTFRFDDYEWFSNYNDIMATIRFNDEAPVELPVADVIPGDEDWQRGVQPLGEFAGKTEPGTYTITFPQGYFILNDDENWDMNNAEMTIVYTIKGETPTPPAGEVPTADPADGTQLAELPSFVTLTFESEWIHNESDNAEATIQFNDNEPVELEYEKDYDTPAKMYRQSLGEFAGKTENGTYTISYPEGYFRLGSWNDYAAARPVPAFKLVYEVKGDDGVTLVGIEADRYIVYNANGMKVLDTTNADDLKALHGLYIVNGVKLVLK